MVINETNLRAVSSPHHRLHHHRPALPPGWGPLVAATPPPRPGPLARLSGPVAAGTHGPRASPGTAQRTTSMATPGFAGLALGDALARNVLARHPPHCHETMESRPDGTGLCRGAGELRAIWHV